MACQFYGKSNVIFRMCGLLEDTYGNECALIHDAHSPCQREIAGEPVDQTTCPISVQYMAAVAKLRDVAGRST